MGPGMENKLSIYSTEISVTPELTIHIPTVGEVIEQEETYLSLISILTSSPFQYMVQLADMGIDYASITPYKMFLLFFPMCAKNDISILFGGIKTDDFDVYKNQQNDTTIIYSPSQDLVIDELVYNRLSDVIRKMNLLKKDNRKPGNENAREYLLEKERKRLKRLERNRKNKGYSESEFEKIIIALVNNRDFKYDYNSILDLSIYTFYQSFKQIQTNINFNNIMHGVYAGTVDISKLKDKSCLSWILAD